MNNKNAAEKRDSAWKSYCERELKNEKRIAELENKSMTFGEATMKYGFYKIGEPEENGYPVFIALHGGGHGDTPDVNDQQWEHMNIYYRESVKNGIYIAPRGVRDTWDTHANPESYPLYDELIKNLILFENADPNRIYIVGFSAGGDGVYLITPKMADRFAAANMSAGCPNGVRLDNLRNMPLIIQAGERDFSFRRNELIAEYDAYLSTLAEEYGSFTHEAYIHFDKAHNYRDNDPSFEPKNIIKSNAKWLSDSDRTTQARNTNAISLMEKYVRNPLPQRVIWNTAQRAQLRNAEYFYWLEAPLTVNEGKIIASYDRNENSITIEENSAAEFSVLINENMLDLDREIKIHINDADTVLKNSPSAAVDDSLIEKTTAARGDRSYQFVCRYTFAKK